MGAALDPDIQEGVSEVGRETEGKGKRKSVQREKREERGGRKRTKKTSYLGTVETLCQEKKSQPYNA